MVWGFFVSSYHNRGQFLSPGSRMYMGNFWNFFGFQLKATVYAYYKPTNSLSYLLYLSSHPSHVKNSIPISQFPDFVVYEVTTLIFRKNQRQCASFSINMAILSLLFKRATTVPNKLIESQHYKRLRRKTLTALHSLSHFTLTTMELNQLFLKTLDYSKTIQRLELSFRNLH